VELTYILLRNLKFIERRKSFSFYLNIYIAAFSAATLTLLHGADPSRRKTSTT